MPPSRAAPLRRLTPYLRGRWGRVVLLVAAAVGQAVAEAGCWLIVRAAVDHGITRDDARYLTVAVLALVAVATSGWLLYRLLLRRVALLGQEIVLRLRRDLFDHLTGLSPRYFSTQRTGWIIARLTSDADAVSDAFESALPTLLAGAVLIPVAVLALFAADARLGLVALATAPAGAALTRWFQRRSSTLQLVVRERIGALTAQLAETLAGMAIVQAFNRQREMRTGVDRLSAGAAEANLRARALSAVFFPGIELLGSVSAVAVLGAGTALLASGDLTVGTVIAALYLLQLVFSPLQQLSDVYAELQSAAAALVKIFSVLDVEPEIRDRSGPRYVARIRGHIELAGVRFAYGQTEVLHGIDLEVPAGTTVAIVGHSGGGKSTIAKLVARFYDPSAGAVLVDGVDLREWGLHDYRRQLGVVLQEPFLFSGTIADNIRFAAPGASDRQVGEAARAVGVDRVAARLEGGLAHRVREGGSGLSAGERQLISIARALLADPRILLLDEASSNIDRPTELLVERALDELLDGRTAIVIAHRLATVARADEIVVLDHGRIARPSAPRVRADRG